MNVSVLEINYDEFRLKTQRKFVCFIYADFQIALNFSYQIARFASIIVFANEIKYIFEPIGRPAIE